MGLKPGPEKSGAQPKPAQSPHHGLGCARLKRAGPGSALGLSPAQHITKQYSIPHTTISNCFHGRKPPFFSHECQKLLTNVQKTVVIEWCRWHGDMTDPMMHAKLHALIYNLTQWTASKNWMCRFLKRNVSQITMNRAHRLDPK